MAMWGAACTTRGASPRNHQLRLDAIRVTVTVPGRYELLDHSSDSDVDRFLIGDPTTQDRQVHERDKVLLTAYHPGVRTPFGIESGNLPDRLAEVTSDHEANGVTVHDAAIRRIAGRDAIVVRSSSTGFGAQALGQEAYLPLADGTVIAIIYTVDTSAVPAEMQRSTFDTILDALSLN
jgi:hypothetical protein